VYDPAAVLNPRWNLVVENGAEGAAIRVGDELRVVEAGTFSTS
jgi:hypothetical protein